MLYLQLLTLSSSPIHKIVVDPTLHSGADHFQALNQRILGIEESEKNGEVMAQEHTHSVVNIVDN